MHQPHPSKAVGKRKRPWLPIVVLLAVGLAAAAVAGDWWIAEPPDAPRTYVGRQTCAQCHQQQLKEWTGSHHDLAMDLATPETVLGNFDDQEFTHYGVTSRMFREGDKYLITTDGKAGELETFEIKYTFGVDPLQQYMVEFPDGRVQVLSIAWDTQKKQWFHLYPNEKIPADDVLHWTAPAQNWNYMCAECHSTNLEKNYDLKTNTYHTTFSEIDVSCEACHGPASLHVKLANQTSLFWDRIHGYGLTKLKGKEFPWRRSSRNRTPRSSWRPAPAAIRGGASCTPDYHPGRDFMDYYEVELLDGDLYHVDGQIRDEVYEYGSFTQSLMHRKGVRCSHCHDPHTARLRAEGNQLCGKCHTPAKYDTPTHHHHKLDTKAAQCVECHMPETTYMVVDPRRDHSIRVPRPDLTVQVGAPNACNGCHEHKSQTAEWARDKIIDWYGPKRREDPHYALAHRGRPNGATGKAGDGRPRREQTQDHRAAVGSLGPQERCRSHGASQCRGTVGSLSVGREFCRGPQGTDRSGAGVPRGGRASAGDALQLPRGRGGADRSGAAGAGRSGSTPNCGGSATIWSRC